MHSLLARLSEKGWAVLTPGPPGVREAMAAATKFFASSAEAKESAKVSSKLGYKRHAQKERFQHRRGAAGPFGAQAAAAEAELSELAALIVRGALLEEDAAELCAGGASVLNFYRYFNDGTDAPENCVEHTDPGVLTLLGRGTSPGLQLDDNGRASATPRCTGAAPFAAGGGRPAAGPRWVLVEPLMQRGDLVVLVGESLARATGGLLPACAHRVVGGAEERLNLAYELRPRRGVYEAMAVAPVSFCRRVGSPHTAHRGSLNPRSNLTGGVRGALGWGARMGRGR